jgi:ribosome-binding protein aMBF1 (putative translation factor)
MSPSATTYSFDEYIAQQMKDPEFRAEYEALEVEFNFIRQLIDLRLKRGLSQRALAERAGTRQPRISRLEHGQLGSFEFLHQVARALDARLEIHLVPHEHPPSA